MLASLLDERIEYLREQLEWDERDRQEMGIPAAPTMREMELDDYRDWCRKRDHQQWVDTILPGIKAEIALYKSNRSALEA